MSPKESNKHPKISLIDCGKIIGLYDYGVKVADIARQVGLSRSSCDHVIDRYKKRGDPTPRNELKGRHRKLSDTDITALSISLKKYPFLPAHYHQEMLLRAGVEVSPRSVLNYAKEMGIKSRIPARKPLLNEKNKKLRLKWAKEKKNWTKEDWNKVIWSDESFFTVDRHLGGLRVFREDNKRYETRNIVPTRKWDGGGVLVWACFHAKGKGPLVILEAKVDQSYYIECLANHFVPWLELLSLNTGKDYIFQEDNATCHTGRLTKEFKSKMTIECLDSWPSQSPDLNPIENIWNALEKGLESRKEEILKKDNLKACIYEEWEKLDVSLLDNLVSSMPARCQAVIKARGGNSKY